MVTTVKVWRAIVFAQVDGYNAWALSLAIGLTLMLLTLVASGVLKYQPRQSVHFFHRHQLYKLIAGEPADK